MQPLSQTRQKALDTAQEYFRAANLHQSTNEFRLKCINDYGFYDGTEQWQGKDLEKLYAR